MRNAQNSEELLKVIHRKDAAMRAVAIASILVLCAFMIVAIIELVRIERKLDMKFDARSQEATQQIKELRAYIECVAEVHPDNRTTAVFARCLDEHEITKE